MSSNAGNESLDSFIDIIANTVGIIIILAVGGILVNVSLKSSKETTIADNDTEITTLNKKKERLTRRNVRLQRTLATQRSKEAEAKISRDRRLKRIAELEVLIAKAKADGRVLEARLSALRQTLGVV